MSLEMVCVSKYSVSVPTFISKLGEHTAVHLFFDEFSLDVGVRNCKEVKHRSANFSVDSSGPSKFLLHGNKVLYWLDQIFDSPQKSFMSYG